MTLAEAYRDAELVRGEGDGAAAEIYAKAYNQSPEAAALYEFLKTMETYKKVIDPDTTLILSTDSELFQYMKGIAVPGGAAR